MVVGGTLFHFGILTSTMHMAWMRAVGGRLKSDYSYSPAVYNNFPWPELPESGAKPLDSRVRGNDEQGRKQRTANETARTEERRLGKELLGRCISRGSRYQ